MTYPPALPAPNRILVIKLADLGDVLTATPALRALRQTWPRATLDLLLTHHTAAAMRYSPVVDNLIPADNFRVFSIKEALRPALPREAVYLLRRLARHPYDAVVILHHLTTRSGALKYKLLAAAARAKIIAGLKPPGNRGRFLTHTIPDAGFGARHEVDYWLNVAALLGASTPDRRPELTVSPADEDWAANVLQPLAKPVVVIHPGSGGFSTARRWHPARFAAVANTLVAEGVSLVLVGQPSDDTAAVKKQLGAPVLDLTGQTSLHQLAALLQQSNLFIGGDSGVTHIASAASLPVIAIFGPTNAAAWGPTANNQVVLQAPIPCNPCAYIDHRLGLRNGCPAKTCLKLVKPEHVIDVARQLLAGQKVRPPKIISLPQPPGALPTANILNVQVHSVTQAQALNRIEQFIQTGYPHQIVTVNPEFVVAAQTDAVFQRIINRAALSIADGTGLLKAARWLNQLPLPERIAGVDTVEALAALSAKKGYRLYFLGAGPGVAIRAIAVLQARYPGMVAAGAFAGSPRAEDEDEIVAKIQAVRPNVILVAYGAPQQDKWIARNMHRLPGGVFMGVGGAFDFVAGTTQRAPGWVRKIGLEWLHRFIRQPWRWRRIWNAVAKFTWLVWRAKVTQRPKK